MCCITRSIYDPVPIFIYKTAAYGARFVPGIGTISSTSSLIHEPACYPGFGPSRRNIASNREIAKTIKHSLKNNIHRGIVLSSTRPLTYPDLKIHGTFMTFFHIGHMPANSSYVSCVQSLGF